MPATDLIRRMLGSRQANHLVRFVPVLELLWAAAPRGGSLLDVGSGSRGIASLLPRTWDVTMLDADFRDYGAAATVPSTQARAIMGDVRAMPFEDSSFDVVIAVDMLEHLAAGDRDSAVAEICRVARRRTVIACPAGADALEADRRIAARLAAWDRPLPGWLREHLENGFPEAEAVLGAAATFGSARACPNENVEAHERLMLAELSPAPAALLRLACIPLARMLRSVPLRRTALRIVKALGGSDRAPTYRVVIDVAIAPEPRDRRHSSE